MSSLPPLPSPDAEAVHVHSAAGSLGPFSRRALKSKVSGGEINSADVFWFDGMTDWLRIGDHPALLAGLDVPAVPATSSSNESDDDRMDKVFGGLVKESWRYFNNHAFASHVDEVFLGAVITSTLDQNYALIDLSSDGTHHYLRFENLKDHSRIIVRVTHLTGDLTRAKVEGHRASVIVGYGERSNDFNKIWQALKAEFKSGYLQTAEPGTITVDGDMNTGYVYVQVDLYLCIDDYVQADYKIKYDVLQDHLGSTLNALKKYLRGRFGN